MGISDRNWSQSHNRAIAAGPVRAVAGSKSVLVGDEIAQRISGGDADVEAAPVHGILACFPPLNVTVGLVIQVPACRGDAVGQGQGHARIVGPLPGLQTVRPAVSVASNQGKAAWGLELDSGPQSIAHG